jgi:hypothetical protein
MKEISKDWYQTFLNMLKEHELATPLKEAAIKGSMGKWTKFLTTVVIKSCKELGWSACAKDHVSEFLPISRGEYLGLDIMAFKEDKKNMHEINELEWSFPIAVFELENRIENRYIAYSLWKVMCARANLRVVFCYRKEPQEGSILIREIQDSVFKTLKPGEFRSFENTMIVIGSRNKSDTFPYGFFKDWILDTQTGKFRRSNF